MKKSVEIRCRSLERRLQMRSERVKALEENISVLFGQINYTQNASDKLNLQRQVDTFQEEIDQEVEEIIQDEKELEKLQREETTAPSAARSEPLARKSLTKILSSYERKIWALLEQSFVFCRVSGWERPQPSSLNGLLLDLEDMQPDKNNVLPLVKFAAALISKDTLPMELYPLLTDWGKQHSANFIALQEHIKQQLISQETANQKSQSYLSIVVENSKISPNEYLVEARLIPDIQLYDPVTGEGSSPLNNTLIDCETYTINDLEVLALGYLEQCKSYRLKHLTIEVFLPLSLLNEAVDSWKRQEYGLPPVSIGCDYSIVVRSTERLKNFGYRDEWEQKWETVQGILTGQTCDLCVDGNADLETLLYELGKPESVILKLTKAPEQVGAGSVFAALLKTATPIALWVRQNLPILPYQTKELDGLLKCCIKDLPDQVREKRRETLKPNNKPEDSHIGHHLALLWEDPSRLPPSTLEYAPPGL